MQTEQQFIQHWLMQELKKGNFLSTGSYRLGMDSGFFIGVGIIPDNLLSKFFGRFYT